MNPGEPLPASLLYGADPRENLVAADLVEDPSGAGDRMALFVRQGAETVREMVPFRPFLLLTSAELVRDFPGPVTLHPLAGTGALAYRAEFLSWQACQKAKTWLGRKTGAPAGAPDAPYYVPVDPVHQYLVQSGRTFFKGMQFGQLRRMQVDIECFTAPGYEFCNAERSEDRIIAIAMADQSGWVEVLDGTALDEAEMLRQFVTRVQVRNPDVLEGHNIFNFDLPYLLARARRHGVPLSLGRDGSVPTVRSSRFTVGERTLGYSRFDVFGRHIVDTLFLVYAYDSSHRALAGFGLKEVAAHFGLRRAGRTLIAGGDIAAVYQRDSQQVLRYASDDVTETCALSALLAPSFFLQAQMVPFSYQNICVRGNATKIDALLIREYLRQNSALPFPERARAFAGGYTDLFVTGVIDNVHHCDVRSLYPSLMLTQGIEPRNDHAHVFLRLLAILREVRLDARRRMHAAPSDERTHWDALQTTFKVLINSFYGYLGYEQGRFNDYDAAERVTAEGRALLRAMTEWLQARGARPIEIDTDGIYFVPPRFSDAAAAAAFQAQFRASLPPGIEIEFDGEYRAMFSYRMKNYALLANDGEVIIRGAALKSRGLEPFQREFLRDLIRCKLEGRADAIVALRDAYAAAIREHRWPIEKFAKTETLQDAPATYAAKRGRGGRGRNAAYELALRSGREYRAGDQVSYYVTGGRADVPIHSNARLVSEWDPGRRDENVLFYLAKLDGLYQKLGTPGPGGEDVEVED